MWRIRPYYTTLHYKQALKQTWITNLDNKPADLCIPEMLIKSNELSLCSEFFVKTKAKLVLKKGSISHTVHMHSSDGTVSVNTLRYRSGVIQA